MRPALFGRIAILGGGLIGGSLAAALIKHNVALHVAVYDADEKQTAYLHHKGFAHSVHTLASEAVKDADVVVLAVPTAALSGLVEVVARHIKVGAIITDVASVKRKAITAITQRLPDTAHYVPGHPIAGSEKSGAEASDPSLFEEKRVILTPSESAVLSEQVACVRSMWEAVGAQVEYMPAQLHDRIYAYVSHLPQIIAYTARPCVNEGISGCEGVLRLAKSSPELWADISLSNADYINEALSELSTFLLQMNLELSENDNEAMHSNAQTEQAPALLCAVIGLCLVATVLLLEQHTNIRAASYGGTGFKSMTTAAGLQSDSVLSAISENPKAVATLLQKVIARINAVGTALASGKAENLIREFDMAS